MKDIVREKSTCSIDTEFCSIIAQLRFPIIAILVFDHFNILNYESLKGLYHEYPIVLDNMGTFVVTLISEICGLCVVPFCFLISGYLFFRTFDGTIKSYSSKIKSRIRSLLYPFLIWNSIGLCFIGVYSIYRGDVIYNVSFFSILAQYWNVSLFPLFIFKDQQEYVQGPIYSHLWYLQYLLFLIILSPLFWIVLKKIPKNALIVTALLWLIHPSVLHYSLVLSHMGLGGVFFFLLGGYFAMGGGKTCKSVVECACMGLCRYIYN